MAIAIRRRRKHLQYICCVNEGHVLSLFLTEPMSISSTLKQEQSADPVPRKRTGINLSCPTPTNCSDKPPPSIDRFDCFVSVKLSGSYKAKHIVLILLVKILRHFGNHFGMTRGAVNILGICIVTSL